LDHQPKVDKNKCHHSNTGYYHNEYVGIFISAKSVALGQSEYHFCFFIYIDHLLQGVPAQKNVAL
jgi:hypothetical protein